MLDVREVVCEGACSHTEPSRAVGRCINSSLPERPAESRAQRAPVRAAAGVCRRSAHRRIDGVGRHVPVPDRGVGRTGARGGGASRKSLSEERSSWARATSLSSVSPRSRVPASASAEKQPPAILKSFSGEQPRKAASALGWSRKRYACRGGAAGGGREGEGGDAAGAPPALAPLAEVVGSAAAALASAGPGGAAREGRRSDCRLLSCRLPGATCILPASRRQRRR